MVCPTRCVLSGASSSVACKSVQPPSDGCQLNDSPTSPRAQARGATDLSFSPPPPRRITTWPRPRPSGNGGGWPVPAYRSKPCPDRCLGTSRVGAPMEQSARRVPGRYPLYLPKWAPSVRRSGRGRGQLAVRVRASPRCHSNGERCAGGAPASAMPTTWPRRVSLALMPFCAPGPGRSRMLRFGPGADSRAFRGHNWGSRAPKNQYKNYTDL